MYGGKLGESDPAGAVFGAPPRSLLIEVMYLLKLAFISECVDANLYPTGSASALSNGAVTFLNTLFCART